MGARRPVRRPFWAPGGPSGGRLGRQEPRIVVFVASSNENASFAQAAGRAQAADRGRPGSQVTTAQSGHCRIFCIDVHTFFEPLLCAFEGHLLSSLGCAGEGAHLEKQVFAWKLCRISLFGLFRARPQNTESEIKNTESSPNKQSKMNQF